MNRRTVLTMVALMGAVQVGFLDSAQAAGIPTEQLARDGGAWVRRLYPSADQKKVEIVSVKTLGEGESFNHVEGGVVRVRRSVRVEVIYKGIAGETVSQPIQFIYEQVGDGWTQVAQLGETKKLLEAGSREPDPIPPPSDDTVQTQMLAYAKSGYGPWRMNMAAVSVTGKPTFKWESNYTKGVYLFPVRFTVQEMKKGMFSSKMEPRYHCEGTARVERYTDETEWKGTLNCGPGDHDGCKQDGPYCQKLW